MMKIIAFRLMRTVYFKRNILCHNILDLTKGKKYFSCSSCLNMKRYFESSEHAKSYTQFRPVYPTSVLETIMDYLKERHSLMVKALDVGCGSGQSTLQLASYFENVIGTDVSAAQIQEAPKDKSGVKFTTGKAEDLSFIDDHSLDLITVAQTMHWLDRDQFYVEAKRVLKENAVIAVYGYGNVTFDKSEANEIVFKEFYRDTLMMGGYWDPQRQHIDNKYADFILPFKDYKRNDDILMEKMWDISELIGYIGTWSGYREYMKKNPNSAILEDITNRLDHIYGNSDSGANFKIRVTWPIFILMGRN